MKKTLYDINGRIIKSGCLVSLDGNMTADNSMGDLPNGWIFDDKDVYEVFFDHTINALSLKLGCKPDSRYNIKYMNHAVSLLHGGKTRLISKRAR